LKGGCLNVDGKQTLNTPLRRFSDVVCNQAKLEEADELFSSEHAYHDPPSLIIPGPEGMKQLVSTYQRAFKVGATR